MSRTFPVTMGRSGIQMIEKLHIPDMVWGLCNLNRFCGKGDRQVSVAAHLLHCYELARIWKPEDKVLHLYALTHDLPEAYYADHPGFLKPSFGPEYKDVIERIDEVIFSQIGLPKSDRIVASDGLHRIDQNTLAIEASYAFDKFESYHWPPMDLYDDIDLIKDFMSLPTKSVYNILLNHLESMGNENEALRNSLHRS